MHASAFSRTSFDHITCASESSTRTGTPASLSSVARAPRIAGAARPASSLAMSTSRNGLVCTTTPGCGPVGLDADRAGEHRVGAEALAQHGDVIEPVEQRQHQLRLRRDPLQRGLQPGGLGGDDQHVDRLLAGARRARGWATNSPKLTLSTRRPRSEITAAVASRATTTTGVPARSSSARDQPAHAAGAEHRDLHGSGSISTPGFMIPRGSTAAFAPRSAAANGSGRWRSYHGPVIAPDGVVVGDRAALGDDRVGDGPLDLRPTARPPRRAARARAP